MSSTLVVGAAVVACSAAVNHPAAAPMYSVRTVNPDKGTAASDVRSATDAGGKTVVPVAYGPNATVGDAATTRTIRIVTRTVVGTCRSSVDVKLTSATYVPVSSAPAAARNDSVVGVTVPASDCVSHGATFGVYVTDDTNHLRGVVSTRALVSAIGRPETKLVDLMKTDLVTANVQDDQEQVAQKVAFYNLLAIPVVDDQRHMLGIITHDDVIDVVRAEATEDVQRIAAVEPLKDSYMRTPLTTLSWKRGIWLTILFFAALTTAFLLKSYQLELERYEWLVLFIPLIISSGGNSGSQSSTLVITALTTKDVYGRDWATVLRREAIMGVVLGSFMGIIGFFCALFLAPTIYAAMVIPITVLFVVICGTCMGSMLPLIFQRLGLDPAMMSNPFVAGLSDILGILIYVNVAMLLLR